MNKVNGLRMESGGAPSLASALTQGDQAKHAVSGHEYLGEVLGQGGRKSGSKGSEHKSLGSALGQGGGRSSR